MRELHVKGTQTFAKADGSGTIGSWNRVFEFCGYNGNLLLKLTCDGIVGLKRPRRQRRTRPLVLERLNAREMLAADLQNPYEAHDVNEDLRVSAMDALLVINALASENPSSGDMLDVNGDGAVTSADALQVINRLGNEFPISVIRLVHDTGPGGLPNNDRLTSDLTTEGRFQWPEDLPIAARCPHLVAYEPDGDLRSVAITEEYIDGDYFQMPSNLLGRLEQAVDPDTLELTVHLQGDPSFPESAEPLATMTIRFDEREPVVKFPDWVATDAQSIQIDLRDDVLVSGISHDPDAAGGISFAIAGQNVPFEWTPTEGLQSIDVRIGEVAEGLDDVIPIDVDAVIEDLAG